MVAASLAALALVTAILWAPALPAGGLLAAAWLLAIGAGRLLAGRRGAFLAASAGLPVLVAVVSAGDLLGRRWVDGQGTGDIGLAGTVCEFPRLDPGSWRFVLVVEEAAGVARAPDRVLVSWYPDGTRPAAPPAPGERWHLDLRLRAPRGLSNPGGFDYERWLFAGRIGATGWVRPAAGNRRLATQSGSCPAAHWRARVADRIAGALAGRESAPYVLGLAIGAYQALPEAEWDRLRRTGTVHLISISGFHIALVAGPAGLAGLLLGRLWLRFGRRCRPPVIGAWTAVAVALGYGALAGFSVPTARSVVAVAVVALLVTWRRTVTVPALLATVAFVVLLIEPLAPLVPGFWLSFAGVIVLAIPVVAARNRGGLHLARALVTTQLAMTAGLAPLLAAFFGQFPAAGLVANLVAVPAFSVVLLPLTLLGTAVATVAPAPGAWLLHRAADGFDAWRLFVAWCAELPGAVWYFPAAGIPALLVAGAGAVLLLWPRPWPGRWLGLPMLLALLTAAEPPVPAGEVRLTVLDVGQGLAVLVQTARHTLLYDAGPKFRGSDAGERVVVPVLQALGVAHLDTLLISHADIDHRGGAAAVLERYPDAFTRGARAFDRAPEPAACTAGTGWQWDGVRFDVLHPPPGPGPGRDNDLSCVLRVASRRGSVLLTGDIEAATEQALVAQAGLGPVDLVVAPHHGSRSSSSPALVGATRPRHVVIAAGYRNRWHFPAPAVVARWRDAGACVLVTAEEGAVRFESGARPGLRWLRSERRAAPGAWLARPPPACR